MGAAARRTPPAPGKAAPDPSEAEDVAVEVPRPLEVADVQHRVAELDASSRLAYLRLCQHSRAGRTRPAATVMTPVRP